MPESPPKNEQETEQGAQSGEEPDQMDREQEGVQQGLGDFEVKEQDRWLPIANGWFCFVSALPLSAVFDLCVPCVTLLRDCASTMALCEPDAQQSRSRSGHLLSFVPSLPFPP